MKLSEYAKFDAVGLAALVRNGEVTAKELAELALAAAEAVNGPLNAIIETFAERSEPNYLASLPSGPLTGVPYLNKDLSFPEKGSLMEMGSQMAAGNVASHDSLAIERLRNAGLVNLGRTTTPEFGLVGVTECRQSGITRNPWDLSRTPSGSSGGSAAAVAAGVVPVATASDGGGSIRGPAANCGLVGLKTSRGRVSLAPGRGESLNGLGVLFMLTRTVRDTAVLLDILQGPGPGDPPGPPPPKRPYIEEVGRLPGRYRVAYTTSLWGHEELSEDVADAVSAAVHWLEKHGHLVEDACPDLDYEPFLDATLKVWSANLARDVATLSDMIGRPPTLDYLQTTTMEMFRYGRSLTASDLLNALAHFNLVNRNVGAFFSRYDLLVTPSSARPAQRIGDFECDIQGSIDLEAWNREIYRHDGFYPLYNTTGQPAISLPLFQSRDGLPIGIQFAAAMGNEALLLRVANVFEQDLPWSARRPPVNACGASI